MSELRIGTFQVLGELGAGAHSKILHIRRSADSRHFALKVVPIDGPDDHKYLEQAQHEFLIGQKLDHPNLIKVYALETIKDWLFRVRKVHLLIEYVNGKTLDTCPRLSMLQLVQVFKAAADGLVHMHRRQIYHADLKPGNIMLSKAGDVKIIDFGLAWLKGEGKDRVQGTPEYMAPEQFKKKIVNERTDVYNFGATMYRMVTLRLPPRAAADPSGLKVDARVLQNLLTPVRELNADAPEALCTLIHHCLEIKPDKRPERMSEVQAVLDRLVDQLSGDAEDGLDALEW
jgi:eukaryotic-like serine/threonine-protein kinase